MTMQDIANGIRNNGKNISLLYAFNSTGKTSLSLALERLIGDDNVLCYNAFTEDIFTWDNETFDFNINDKLFLNLIQEQGIENEIANNFKLLTNSKIEPKFDFVEQKVSFRLATGDDKAVESIKISRSEESIFIWTTFYTYLATAIETLMDNEEDRSTNIFDELKYVIIDDPVSSIDDTRIISVAVALSELIKKYQGNKVRFLLTTHHALFYNVLYNELNIKNGKKIAYLLSKNNNELTLAERRTDSPFSYHLSVLSELKIAVENGDIKKYHFNMFRNLLEKTSNFFGFEKWSDCLSENSEFIRKINLYSHSSLSDLEYKEISDEDKHIFQDEFNTFVSKYAFRV